MARHYARIRGEHILNITDQQIAKEFAQVTGDDGDTTVVSVIVGALLSVAVSAVIIAVLVYICLWYGVMYHDTFV